MNLLALKGYSNNYNNYCSYQMKNNQSENSETPVVCESIFIYTCEPKEQLSFKGNVPVNSSLAKTTVLPALAAIGGVAASVFSRFRKGNTHEEDVKRIIQNQKDMEYICALKRNFVPHSEFDEMVLKNYNKNLNMLENVNKALISKIVDEVLTKKNFRDLPADYPERIKEQAYCLSTWGGDCFTLGEKDVEYFILKLKEEDAEKAKMQEKEKAEVRETPSYFIPKKMEQVYLGKFEPDTVLNAFGIKSKSTLLRDVMDLMKAKTKEEKDIRTITEIQKSFECGDITSKEAVDKIIELLESIKIQPDCICDGDNSNVNEGIIDIIA